MGTYYYAIIPQYKLIVRLGHSHFDERLYREMKEELSHMDDNEIYDMSEKLDDLRHSKVSDLTVDDMGTMSKAADLWFTMREMTCDKAWEFAVYILFRDEITEIRKEGDLKDFPDYTRID